MTPDSPGQMLGQQPGLCWGSAPGATLFQLAEAAAAAGLEWISPTPGQVLDELARGLVPADIRGALADLGVRVSVLDPLIRPVPGVPAPAAVEERMRWLFEPTQEQCWRAAEAVDAPAINFTQFLGQGVARAQLFEELVRLAEANRAQGFASTIEFIPGTGVPDLPAAAELTAATTGFTVLFDTWHYARSGGTLDQIAALPPGAIGAVQVNDWCPPEPGAAYVPMAGRLTPGTGTLPLGAILQQINANSPGLVVGIEVFNAALAGRDYGESASILAEATIPFLATPTTGKTPA